MARTRKPKPPVPEGEEEEAGGENRPSQLDAIRAALSDSPSKAESEEETPETGAAAPQPEEEPELPAHEDEPAVAATDASEPEPEPEPEPAPAESEPAGATGMATTSAPASAWVPPPGYAPPGPPPSAGQGSGLALGIVLVVVGIFFLIMRVLNVDLSTYGWPLYVIIPGLTLLVVGFVSFGTGALVPGGIITMIGLVLAYQNATSDWASWAFAWTLVAPGGVGVGLFLQGLRVHDSKQMRTGRNLMLWAALLFMIGFVVFESIFQISGHDYGIVGRAALPVLLIAIGVTLLARSVRSGRSA